jgi:hypothetical protein
MTQDDEETKEHPVYPEAPKAVDPVPSAAPSAGPPATQPAVDPLEPTTTVNVVATPPAYPQTPSQGWSGPPPGAANLPTQGQWQSPGHGQPGYAAGYPQAQTGGAPTYKTSVLVALAAMLLVIGGVALAVLGAWLLTQGPALSDLVQRLRSVDLLLFEPTRETIRSVVSASPGALMVLGVLQLLVGAFVLRHRSWARWLGVLLGLLGLMFSIVAVTSTMALVPGTSVQLVVAAAFLVVYALVVLVLIAGGSHFRAQYPRAR